MLDVPVCVYVYVCRRQRHLLGVPTIVFTLVGASRGHARQETMPGVGAELLLLLRIFLAVDARRVL